MRNTKYAEELAMAKLKFPGGSEARIERLRIKSSDEVEIRFSWWKKGRMLPRPLDLSEGALMQLLARGFRKGVLLPEKSQKR